MSYDEELRGFRKAMDEWVPVGHMSRDQELLQLAQLIERYPEQARESLRHYDETAARLRSRHRRGRAARR
ncbi:hypothetical protein [Actinoallomurus sp. NPDC052274]|uniref:hypothetical protein n=1 Tax=Actinoallomurus sp. NPDC052274 TaxID=3155420 RepID=UPI00343BD73B